MASIVETIREYLGGDGGDDDYEVEEYVLERREPDTEHRVRAYDERVSPEEVAADGDLPSGVYLLQEVKTSGMAGDVVWTEELATDSEAEA